MANSVMTIQPVKLEDRGHSVRSPTE